MNELLQKHGCANVFSVPEGLKELMADITREVLRAQPPDINDFVANYLSVLLITREHGVMAVSILKDLCDCRPSVLEHLHQLGMEGDQAQLLSDIIKEEIEGSEKDEGKETIKEYQIIKKILARRQLDEVMTAKVCQVARNAYRDYWYRKQTLEKGLKMKSDVPWEIAAEHTLELYKKTKPTFTELTRATEKIQAAYRGYHIRRNILRHLKPKSKKKGPKVELPGPPIDLCGSREIDLGPMIDIKVRADNVEAMFDQHTHKSLGLAYDPMKTITLVPGIDELAEESVDRFERKPSIAADKTSLASKIPSQVPISTLDQIQLETSRASIVPALRQSRSPSSAELSQSRPPSVAPVDQSGSSNLKISFANVPAEVIQSISRATSETDAAEVPEDIVQDDHSDADGASEPTASVPSSAPSTANTTDVEDETGLNTSGDEE